MLIVKFPVWSEGQFSQFSDFWLLNKYFQCARGQRSRCRRLRVFPGVPADPVDIPDTLVLLSDRHKRNMATLAAYGLVGLACIAVPAALGGIVIWYAPEYAIRKLAIRYPRVVWFIDPASYRGIPPPKSASPLETEDNSAFSVLSYIVPRPSDLLDDAYKQRSAVVGERDKLIALSIDDGPGEYTLEILEVLRRYNCTATLFFIGQQLVDFVSTETISTNPILASSKSIAKQLDSVQDGKWQYKLPSSQEHIDKIKHFVDYIESLGHEVGNHTWFDRRTAKISHKELEQELEWMDDLMFSNWHPEAKLVSHIESVPVSMHSYLNHKREDTTPIISRRKRKLFRPGHGYFNDTMVSIAQERSYHTIIGSVYPHDPHIPVPHVTSFHVLSRARPGAVIALHDGRRWSVDTIERVVKGLTDMGYRIMSVGELMDWGDVNGQYPGGSW